MKFLKGGVAQCRYAFATPLLCKMLQKEEAKFGVLPLDRIKGWAYNKVVPMKIDIILQKERKKTMKKTMKTVASVLLAFVLVVSMLALTACEKAPKELLEEADKTLSENPHVMNMKMNFTCDDEEFNSLFTRMNLEFPITYDGNNLFAELNLADQGMALKLTLIEKVLYYDMQVAGIANQKMKCTLSDEQLKEFMGEQSMEMPVDYSQFAELKSETKDGKTVITCTGISDDGKKALNDMASSSLDILGGGVVFGDLSYTITLKDGKYEAMNLVCTYTVSTGGESISVNISMGTTFSYDNVSAVTAPDDADSFTSFNYSDLFGKD